MRSLSAIGRVAAVGALIAAVVLVALVLFGILRGARVALLTARRRRAQGHNKDRHRQPQGRGRLHRHTAGLPSYADLAAAP